MNRGLKTLPKKSSSNECIGVTEDLPEKQTLSVRKGVDGVLDRWGIILVDFLTRGENVNAERYRETLKKLRRAIENKLRGMFSADVVLLYYNARPHKARRSTHLPQEFSWEIINHPPYIPDLAPSDFHIFLLLKKFLSAQRQLFQNDREAKIMSHSGSNPRRQTDDTRY